MMQSETLSRCSGEQLALSGHFILEFVKKNIEITDLERSRFSSWWIQKGFIASVFCLLPRCKWPEHSEQSDITKEKTFEEEKTGYFWQLPTMHCRTVKNTHFHRQCLYSQKKIPLPFLKSIPQNQIFVKIFVWHLKIQHTDRLEMQRDWLQSKTNICVNSNEVVWCD